MKRIAMSGAGVTVLLMVVSLAVMAQGSRVNSPHKKLERSCERCHVPTAFDDIHFEHHSTRFPLEGHHEDARCLLCHSVEDFSKVERACASCHRDVHAGRLHDDCETCHTPHGWDAFDAGEIHSRSDFPLMGRHILLDCESCHAGQTPADLRQTASDCVSCHQQDYLDVDDPNHAGNGFSTQCEECHEPTGWRPGRMPDHDVFFPIFSGTHRNQWDGCETCHAEPGNRRVFDCLGCHEHGQQAMEGAHGALAGYAYESNACYGCHPSGEVGRFVEHDAQFFPIYSGTHNATWSECGTCHSDPANRRVFTCLDCHEHSQLNMDVRHAGFTGYAYESNACYSCHPSGTAERFVAHDAQFFPIFSGTHNGAWSDCSACHTTPGDRRIFSCVDCHAHQQVQTDAAHPGMPGYAYDSGACYGCHPNGVAGSFVDHDAQYFPIYSGFHRNRWSDCSTCHYDPAQPSLFTCIDCHAHRQDLMDSKHQDQNGYQYNSRACLGCHPDGRG